MKDYKGVREKPIIQMLTSCFGWDKGSRFNIHLVDDDGTLYFYDVYHRWTVVEKSDEGKEFIWVRKDENEA